MELAAGTFRNENICSGIFYLEYCKALSWQHASSTKPVVSRLFWKPFNRRQKLFNRTVNRYFAVRNFGGHMSEKIAANFRLLQQQKSFCEEKDRKALVFFWFSYL